MSEMTLQQMAERVLAARMEGDLRYEEFIQRMSNMLNMPPAQVEQMTFMAAMGMRL